MDEASAAKLEELRLGAVSQGREWLSRSLSEMTARQLRVLAAAGGAKTHSRRCMSSCSISHCITFCFQMKKQEMMPTDYGSWC